MAAPDRTRAGHTQSSRGRALWRASESDWVVSPTGCAPVDNLPVTAHDVITGPGMVRGLSTNGSFTEGVWGPVTSTLDWCEGNYKFSYYVAEVANTYSNLVSIALALYGLFVVRRESLPIRCFPSFVGFALVAIGSFAFHATLLYQAQLADELPMIYVVTYNGFVLFDTGPGFGIKSRRTKALIIALFLFDVIFTVVYCMYRNPVFHQVVFASLMLINTSRVFYLLRWSDASKRIPEESKHALQRLFRTGFVTFALGFVIWNLDNMYCDDLTRWKVALGWPTAFLLEGHSWWHILTATGSYLQIIGIIYLTLCIKDDARNYVLVSSYGITSIKRVTRAKKE